MASFESDAEANDRDRIASNAEAEPLLSVVLPAYNEAKRLRAAIDDIICGIPLCASDRWELIVVNDGSNDQTSEVASQFARLVPCLKLLHHQTNRGKGAAVRTGVLASRGRFVMFADADGATPFVESHNLMQALEEGAAVAVGTRIRGSANRSFSRGVMALIFRAAVRMIVRVQVRDPQCGFKLFAGHHARSLFRDSTETGYLFDLEVLGLAQRRGLGIQEVPVRWQEIPGSHVHIIRDSVRMFTGLWRVRRSIRRHILSDRRAGISLVETGAPISDSADAAGLTIASTNTVPGAHS